MAIRPVPDRRFDKPKAESLVDLVNFSCGTTILYGEVEYDLVQPLPEDQIVALPHPGRPHSVPNTTVRIRLAGARPNDPTVQLRYVRLPLDQYIRHPQAFIFDDEVPVVALFEQLKLRHHVWLDSEDCEVEISPIEEDGGRTVQFIPSPDHPIWLGSLTIRAMPRNHISWELNNTILNGLTYTPPTA